MNDYPKRGHYSALEDLSDNGEMLGVRNAGNVNAAHGVSAMSRMFDFVVSVRSMLSGNLVFRAVAGLLGMLALMSAVMLFSIDRLVVQQFTRWHNESVASQNYQIRQAVQNEVRIYGALAVLIATDSDLHQSAKYHVYLEGEIVPLESDIDRIVSAFDLDWLAVFDPAKGLIAISDDSLAWLAEGFPEEIQDENKAWASLAWINRELWVLAAAPIKEGDDLIGWIHLGRQAAALAGVGDTMEKWPSINPTHANTPQPESSVRIPVWSVDADISVIDMIVVNPAREAVTRTTRIIYATLLVSAAIFAVATIIYLHRLLIPVRHLTTAVSHLPAQLEKDRPTSLDVKGRGDVRKLVNAFNNMIGHLSRLRQLESEAQAREKWSAIGRVAMRVAHDLNNPMTVIKNTAYLLKPEVSGNPILVSELDLILHHCARCSSTIDNLLRFGKPVKLKFEPIELEACMRNYLVQLQHHHSDAQIELTTHAGGPYYIRGDRHQLEQMIDNLIDNALEANQNQKVEIVIGVDRSGRYFIKITDFGRGFQDDELEKVFDLFFTTKAMGSGLGLSNAYAIAQAHGGDIQITDPERGGITIWLVPSSEARLS